MKQEWKKKEGRTQRQNSEEERKERKKGKKEKKNILGNGAKKGDKRSKRL